MTPKSFSQRASQGGAGIAALAALAAIAALLAFADVGCNSSHLCGNCLGGFGGAGGSNGSGGRGGAFVIGIDASFAGIPACSAEGGVDAAAPIGDAATGCEGIEGGVDYASQVRPIIGSCAGELCHTRWTATTLVNQPASECCDGRALVTPGIASQSYLVNKVTGEGLCAGTQMPFGGPYLSDADIVTLQRWICEGAPGQ